MNFFTQFEDMVLTPVVAKLKAKNINIEVETLRQAIHTSPQLIFKIREALSSGTSQERIQKIIAMIQTAAHNDDASRNMPDQK